MLRNEVKNDNIPEILAFLTSLNEFYPFNLTIYLCIADKLHSKLCFEPIIWDKMYVGKGVEDYDINPREKANPLSILVFAWVNSYFFYIFIFIGKSFLQQYLLQPKYLQQ